MTLECLGVQSDLGVRVRVSSLYVLWPVGFAFVMGQGSDGVVVHHMLCLHLFVFASIQQGDTVAFVPKYNVFISPIKPSAPCTPLSSSCCFPLCFSVCALMHHLFYSAPQ